MVMNRELAVFRDTTRRVGGANASAHFVQRANAARALDANFIFQNRRFSSLWCLYEWPLSHECFEKFDVSSFRRVLSRGVALTPLIERIEKRYLD